uniref:Uncharacterized protein TCIL3000_4_440 n=1 Tax=Trypanosoma congolense (strain IL3000) TaxID=1068625 RepID=G0UKQ7_TRYCI|nr:unnamed protein product [Trypanosoma congolense IL3000]
MIQALPLLHLCADKIVLLTSTNSTGCCARVLFFHFCTASVELGALLRCLVAISSLLKGNAIITLPFSISSFREEKRVDRLYYRRLYFCLCYSFLFLTFSFSFFLLKKTSNITVAYFFLFFILTCKI